MLGNPDGWSLISLLTMDYAVLVFGLDFVLLDTMWQRNLSF